MAPGPPRRRRDGPKQRPGNLSGAVAWTYGFAVQYGVLRADDSALCTIEEAVQTAQRASSDIALIFAEYALGGALLNRDTAADRHRGLEIMVQAREWQRERMPSLVPATELLAGRERARRGDRDSAIPVMRNAVDELHQEGGSGMALPAPAFWWKRCWSVTPKAIWPKLKRRSTGWRTCGR